MSNVLFESDNVIGRAHLLFAFIIVLHKKINSTFIAKYLQKFIITPKSTIFRLYKFNKIMQISFGKKIPIAKCNIINKKTKKPENATIFEYECNSRSDLERLSMLAEDKKWEYGYCIWSNGYNKNHSPNSIYGQVGVYSIEDSKGRTVCICDTVEDEKEIIVKHIESRKNSPYKYAGQNMLAMLAKKVITTNREDLFINDGQPDAQDFYKVKCRFDIVGSNPKDEDGIDFEMKREDIPHFLSRIEEKTKGKIISLQI